MILIFFSFQDAVQTLIDAVQELIQTHEAWEEDKDPENKPDLSVKDSKETEQDTSETHEEQEPARKETEKTEDAGHGLSEEVWSSLRREYPGAEFVVVTDQ